MKKHWFTKSGALLIALVLLATMVLGACGGSPATSTTPADTSAPTDTGTAVDTPAEPVTIKWMSILHTDSPPSQEMIEAVNKLANVDLTFQWVPAASREEKLNAALASNTLADIVTLVGMENATVRAALASGLFWDVEPYLQDYPNLADISEGRINSVRVDGVLYGVPMVKPVARYGVVIRQDWLDNLGLDVPHTFEDLMVVAMAFTTGDPDGDGIDGNTYGIVDREESFNLGFRMVSGWFGASCFWGINDEGNFQPWFMDEGYYNAVEAYRTLYAAGAINSDFAVMTKNDQQQAIAQSKGGIVITGLQDTRNYVNLANDIGMGDTMKWTQINDMHTEGVDRRILSDTGNGVGGLYAMPRNEVKDETELRACLQFLNDIAGEEGFMLFTNGIEGKHYEMVDGVVTITDETIWKAEVQALSSSRVNELVTYQFKTSNDILNESNVLIPENEEFAVYDLCRELTSESYNTVWSQLLDIPKDAFFKYVMGEITMEQLKAENDKWLSQGGQTMIEEFTADYNRIYG